MTEQSDCSSSINSLVDATSFDCKTQYSYQGDDHLLLQVPDFMQSLIDHLVELSITQGVASNIKKMLGNWVREYQQEGYRNPKHIIQGFFGDFMRLFSQETAKINKYGQKKLKYLTQTVSRQIFTQIMRMACDFKMQTANRINYLKSPHRVHNNIVILTYSINRFFLKQKSFAFKTIKKALNESIEKQQNFINKFTHSLSRLNKLSKRNRHHGMFQAFSKWKSNSINQAEQQIKQICDKSEYFFEQILQQIVSSQQSSSNNWIVSVCEKLQKLLKSAIVPNTQIQLIANPYFQQQHLTSLDYSALSSYRSNATEMTVGEMQQIFRDDQIKYNNEKKYVVIPIIGQHNIGVVKIKWVEQLPIVYINKVVKIVQQIQKVIEGCSKLIIRFESQKAQRQNVLWNKNLYEMAFSQQMIDSTQPLITIMNSVKISYIQIYHDLKIPLPCIKYGSENVQQIPESIYHLIWEKLQTVSFFQLSREDSTYSIAKLQHSNGFIRYSFQQKNQNQGILVQCLASLIVKNLGKIGCSICNVKVRENINSERDSIEIKLQKKHCVINYESVLRIKQSQNIEELENISYECIRKTFSKVPVFAKLYYNLKQSKDQYVYRQLSRRIININQTIIPKSLVNQHMMIIDPNESDRSLLKFVQTLHSGAMFDQSQIYLYENQKNNNFTLVSKKIPNKGLLIMGSYQHAPESILQNVADVIVKQIEQNRYAFKRTDLQVWAMDTLFSKDTIKLPTLEFTINLFSNIHKMNFEQICLSIMSEFNSINCFTWKVNQQKISSICGSSSCSEKTLFKSLTQQPIQSHLIIPGESKTLRTKECGNVLEQIFSYVPNFHDTLQKIKLAGIISKMTYVAGQGEQLQFLPIYNYLRSICHFNIHTHQFLSIPVKQSSKTYVFLMVLPKDVYITKGHFSWIVCYFQKIIPEILQLKREQLKVEAFQKFKKGQVQFMNFNRRLKIKQSIKIFFENKNRNRHIHQNIINHIIKIRYCEAFKALKFSFDKIKDRSQNYKQFYQDRCSLFVKRVSLVFSKCFIKNIQSQIKMNKGICIFDKTFNNMLKKSLNPSRLTYRMLFDTLKIGNEINKIDQINKKQKSVRDIERKFNLIYQRNLRFFFQVSQQKLHFLQRQVKLLIEQFQLLQPKNSNFCLSFLNGRISLILKNQLPIQVFIQQKLNYQNNLSNDQNLEIIEIRNSSFVLILKENKAYRAIVQKLLLPFANAILSQWQTKYQKNIKIKTKIMTELLYTFERNNLRLLFKLYDCQINKENIKQLSNIHQQAKQQSEKIKQLSSICNPSLNLQKRENHKKHMDKLKQEANIGLKILDEVEVETRIKSKTNSVSKMLNIIGQREMSCLLSTSEVQKSQALQQIKKSIEQEKFEFVCEMLPTWIKNLNKIMRKVETRRACQFIQALC